MTVTVFVAGHAFLHHLCTPLMLDPESIAARSLQTWHMMCTSCTQWLAEGTLRQLTCGCQAVSEA